MTHDTQTSAESKDPKRIPFGKRLKTAREGMSLDRKDVAAQLHLNEKVILMMESDRYPSDLPVTFIRGYLRSYAKLLQIPDYEIRQAIEPIKPKAPFIPTQKASEPINSGSYFIQFFTYLISTTVVGLVGIWWYTHYTSNFNFLAKSTFINPPHQVSSISPSTTETIASKENEVHAQHVVAAETTQNEIPKADASSQTNNPMTQLNATTEKKEEDLKQFPYTAMPASTQIEQPEKNNESTEAKNTSAEDQNKDNHTTDYREDEEPDVVDEE